MTPTTERRPEQPVALGRRYRLLLRLAQADPDSDPITEKETALSGDAPEHASTTDEQDTESYE